MLLTFLLVIIKVHSVWCSPAQTGRSEQWCHHQTTNTSSSLVFFSFHFCFKTKKVSTDYLSCSFKMRAALSHMTTALTKNKHQIQKIKHQSCESGNSLFPCSGSFWQKLTCLRKFSMFVNVCMFLCHSLICFFSSLFPQELICFHQELKLFNNYQTPKTISPLVFSWFFD